MFDLEDDQNTRSSKQNAWDRLDKGEPGIEKKSWLDNEENDELFRRLIAYYQQELDRQTDNRKHMAIDEDFYDSIQWDEEDASILKQRGQSPTVYNVISQSVNWIIGTEKRGRTDFKILPRDEDASKPAQRKTELLKYLADVNRTQFHRSRAFEDAVKVGVGWLEDGVQDDDEGEPIYSRYESWRNILYDSASTEMDLSDCRYVIRTKWADTDVAIALFPERKDLIERSAQEPYRHGYDLQHGDEVMDQHEQEMHMHGSDRILSANRRDRVRLIEVWFRKPENTKKIIRGQFRGEIFDENNPGHVQFMAEVERQHQVGGEYAGRQVLANRLVMRMHCAIMTTEGLLYVGRSPYNHNRFPFTPIWGYRRGRDGLPYGIIRGLRDIQESINKRASKALYILSTNKIIADEGAVDDVEELRQEAARPDAVLIKKKGYELALNADKEMAQAHLEWMGRDISMVQQVGGVTDEQMGRTTNAQSGRAIEARQLQGSMTTAKLFDNLRFSQQMQGEIQLSLEEQFYTEQKRFRITNERGNADFVTVNDGLPENDITSTKADFVISDSEWRASMREAAAEQMLEMMQNMPPQVSMVMLDLVVESMDIPNREELVKRIRQINGQRDPDNDEPTPEEQQQMELQQRQQQLEFERAEAEVRKLLAEAGKTEAETEEVLAQLRDHQNEASETYMSAQEKAIKVAQEALKNPAAANMADTLLRESGFMSQSEKLQEAQRQARQQRDEMQAQGGPQQPSGPAPAQGGEPAQQSPEGGAPVPPATNPER